MEYNETEQKIIDAARAEFIRKGFAATRMKDIAQTADINQALLHYYFRNKDLLFEKVFQEAVLNFFPIIMRILESDQSIEDKIRQVVSAYINFLSENPHVPGFIIHEITQNPDRLVRFLRNAPVKRPERFLTQFADGVRAGKYLPIDPLQLVINIISLCVFPFVARPMFSTVLEMNDAGFDEFIARRKEQLTHFIINGIYSR